MASKGLLHATPPASFSEADFNALLEAAADFSDYRSGQYFAKRDSQETPETRSPLRLRDSAILPTWALDLRRMLNTLSDFEFDSKRRSPLSTMCEVGVRFGWQELEREISPGLLALVSQKAKGRLRRELQQILDRVTRPCVELQRTSYNAAMAAIGLQEKGADSKFASRKFLGKKPSERLFAIFRQFPVLSRLWFQLISQWCDQVIELLVRVDADRSALSRAFLGGQPAGSIVDLRCGLSDPHNKGRTVMLFQFKAGSIIYKPRSGDGEWEWFSFLHKVNALSFLPKLKAALVLRRPGYCWMEPIEPSSCEDRRAACRFYRRMGGIMGAAYLLRAADCHRDNVIAAGEYPVLVDAEALWHLAPETKAQTPAELLGRTGFLPGSTRRSLQSRSSVLGGAITGQHVPKIGGKALRAADYEREIIEGFSRFWHCVLGTKNQRTAFVRRLHRISSRKRRRIYRSTEKYAAIARAAIQPGAVRSGIERELLLARLCSRRTVPSKVIHAEIAALKRIDIPYFVRRGKGRIPTYSQGMPADVREALWRVLVLNRTASPERRH